MTTKERPLSASQLNLLDRAREPGGVLISGFDGEHHTARSLVNRGYVTLTRADGGKWRVEPLRQVQCNGPVWADMPCDCGAGKRGHTCPPHNH